jgi:hypothetical protein
MLASDHSIQLSRQHINDLHAQADRQRLARTIPTHPRRPVAALRQLAATVVLAAAPVLGLLVETAGRRNP